MTPGGNHRPADRPWPAQLAGVLSQLPEARRIWLAYSGGLDSTLLLHLLCDCLPPQLRRELHAVHINHQLQPNAGACEASCRQTCRTLGVSLTVEVVTVVAEEGNGGGLEAAARQARYRVFESLLGPDDLLLMAHHGDDQAETRLFRFLRGSGVAGLAGMPQQRRLGQGRLYRPLLAFRRSQLRDWAMAAGLHWVEDPSNEDRRFDRNFLRHEILPRLRQRWPGLDARLARTAGHCAEQVELAESLARIQAAQCVAGDGCLLLDELAALSPAEQKNLVRWWLGQQGFEAPGTRQLESGLAALVAAAGDRAPEMAGPGYRVLRYHNRLHLVPQRKHGPETPAPATLSPGHPVVWNGGRLRLERAGPETPAPEFRVTRRQGGERFREHTSGPSRPLKKWLQEHGIPPWQRETVPLVWQDDELVAIGPFWQAARFAGKAPASGWRIVWEPEFD